MKISFLSANEPIKKVYELDTTGNLIKHPYPFVYEFTSQTHDIQDLPSLLTAIEYHAANGGCLLKGLLHRQLVHESRAGSTDRNDPTEWICLDLDGVEGFQSTSHFLDAIGLTDVSYIRQWSSSQGVEARSGFRCHLFLQLAKPTHPQLIKQWLMHLNLTQPNLVSQLELTKTSNSLRWPLDISTCQNDKLLYVAPPEFLSPLTDPFYPTPRIELVQRGRATVSLPTGTPNHDALRGLVHDQVNLLRAKAGLTKRKKTSFKFQGAVEYFVNPDRATITDMKTERGFVYFNLNGGDSWAYYHPEDNPAFIHNFKGEPIYRTEDLLPEYWAQIAQRVAAYQPGANGRIYLAFRDFKSGNYFNGIYDSGTGELEFAQAKSETQLRHFMKQHGQPLGDYIPDWNIVFDPHKSFVVDPNTRQVNIFEPSAIMKQVAPEPAPFPTIAKVIEHVLGNDPATIDHFYNWLAVATQKLSMTGTAWVLHGRTGTGKGVLFHHILSPLFGDWNVVSKRMEEIESEFTGYMENKFIVFVDEMEKGRGLYHEKVNAKLKNLITEPKISVRKMYQPATEMANYANMLFASNKPAPVEIAPDDRRFNVGAYQPNSLVLTDAELFDDIPAELPGFYGFLMAYAADTARARKPLISQHRAQMIDISTNAIDIAAQAILDGNMDFFWDQLKDKKPQQTHLTMATPEGRAYEAYRDLVVDIVTNRPTSLSREELRILFEWTVGNMPDRPHKFTSLIKHHKLHMQPVWRNGRTTRGLNISWQTSPAHPTMMADISAGNV
jgi:Predicted ATPase